MLGKILLGCVIIGAIIGVIAMFTSDDKSGKTGKTWLDTLPIGLRFMSDFLVEDDISFLLKRKEIHKSFLLKRKCIVIFGKV